VAVFPNVTTSTDFATLGYEADREFGNKTPPTGSGFSVSYDAATKNYVMDFPVSEPGAFEASNPNDRWLGGKLTDPANPGQFQAIAVTVVRPDGTDVSLPQFEYTTFSTYLTNSKIGYLAFGLPTAQPGVPITGSATYTAYALGQDTFDDGLDGTASLQFNFGTGSLSGTFDPRNSDWGGSLGHFDFANTVFGVGQTQFSGQFSAGGSTPFGSFNGLFTGPSAQEVMAHWSFPYRFEGGGGDTVFYGVWIGKKN